MATTTNYNILVIGNAGVGKTNLISMLADNEFNRMYIPTQGIETTNIPYKNISFNVSEFAGQEQYGFKRKLIEINVNYDAIILMYDCTSKLSYKNLEYWYNTINSTMKKQIPMIIVGNKCDVQYIKSDSQRRSYVFEQHNFKFFKISARVNDNVKEVFDYFYSMLV